MRRFRLRLATLGLLIVIIALATALVDQWRRATDLCFADSISIGTGNRNKHFLLGVHLNRSTLRQEFEQLNQACLGVVLRASVRHTDAPREALRCFGRSDRHALRQGVRPDGQAARGPGSSGW
jgi:hypothetical protein